MIKKVKSNLWLKIFLMLLAILFFVSFLLYGIVMTIMPASYENLADERISNNVEQLVKQLESSTLDDASEMLTDFCIDNNAAVRLEGEDTKLSFGTSEISNKSNDEEMSLMTFEIENDIEIKFLGSDTIYTLTICTTRQIVQNITQSFCNILPIISVIIILISSVGAYFIAHTLTKPILEISEISNRFARLNLTGKCKVDRSDEIGILARNLNTMSTRLDETMKKLTEANEKLQFDIERERQQEKLRVDFFRAVSHELKTPITILKGELEGMIYQVGEYKDRDTYLRKSICTVNDMEQLVREIISASRVSESDFSMAFSEINLGNLIHQCCRRWQGFAEDKCQTFFIDIEDGCSVYGDMDLLNKAISNIIGNAVMHSPKQELIEVSLKNKTLKVYNSGVKIADTDLSHVFEPFYRTDISRSRETGGSGLGLSIVKAVFDRHGIKYNLQNTEHGVCFTVFFEYSTKIG